MTTRPAKGIPSALTVPPSTSPTSPAAAAYPAQPAIEPAAAAVVGFLPSPRPPFERNYAESLDIYTDGHGRPRLIQRENWGVTIWDLTTPATPQLVDGWYLEGRPGYRKGGEGYNTVVCVTAAPDGSRFLVNWTEGNHGTLLLTDKGANAGEFVPNKMPGGVALVREGDRWIGYALNPRTPAVSRADVTNFLSGTPAVTINSIPHTAPAAPPGSGLVSDGTQACYCTASGDLVTLGHGGPNGSVFVQPNLGAYAVALGVGGRSAIARVFGAGHEVLVEGRSYPLPNFASALCWAGSSWYAWTGDGHTVELWSAAGRFLVVNPADYPRNDGTGGSLFARAVVCRGYVDAAGVPWLIVGTKDATAIVRVGA